MTRAELVGKGAQTLNALESAKDFVALLETGLAAARLKLETYRGESLREIGELQGQIIVFTSILALPKEIREYHLERTRGTRGEIQPPPQRQGVTT